jgi:polysaccharide biosynthesis protein PslJ
MSTATPPVEARSAAPVAVLVGALGLLAATVVAGASPRAAVGLLLLVTLAVVARISYVGWSRLLGVLVLIILFVPIRRYALPANLPFQLELYRVVVALLVLGWVASLLVDRRTRLRRTGLELPLLIILGAAFASILANPAAVAAASSQVNKGLMFFLSFVLVFYLTATAIRRLDEVDYLAKVLVGGGAVVALFAIIEGRTNFNVFNHLSRVMPFLIDQGDVGGFDRVGTGKLRVFASAQHPIALSAALVMLIPLALYLARRYRQRRWMLCALALVAASAAAVSRTGIVMLIVVGVVFLWLRPRETRRLWPALLLAPLVIHFALPGTLGAIKNSFFPAGGLVAQQKVQPGTGGSGRLADLGPALREWSHQPLFGEGFATRVVDAPSVSAPVPGGPGLDPNARILDDQWLGTLLETGALGAFGWLWLFGRAIKRFGAEARRDDSERGWLLASITAGVAAYAVGMLTYDAFAFIQVTFLLFIFLGLGAALLAERPTPLAVRTARDEGSLSA